jgi:hypothetical protein
LTPPLWDIARREPTGLAIEWGFPGDLLWMVEGLIGRGYLVWYLDADPAAARLSWLRRHPADDPATFDVQAQGLVQIDAPLSRVFGPRRLTMLQPDGTRLTNEELAAVVLGPAPE